MLATIRQWIERRRALKSLCREHARQLVERNPETAYYDAQRAAASARYSGDVICFRHWIRVAAEIARTSNAPMDFKTVREIVEEERRRSRT